MRAHVNVLDRWSRVALRTLGAKHPRSSVFQMRKAVIAEHMNNLGVGSSVSLLFSADPTREWQITQVCTFEGRQLFQVNSGDFLWYSKSELMVWQ